MFTEQEPVDDIFTEDGDDEEEDDDEDEDDEDAS